MQVKEKPLAVLRFKQLSFKLMTTEHNLLSYQQIYSLSNLFCRNTDG